MKSKYEMMFIPRRNEADEFVEGGGDGADPLGLGLDLSGVDTSRPALPEGMYVLEVKEVKKEASKKTPGNHNLLVVFATTSDARDIKDERTLSAGYQIRKYYPLQQSTNEKAPEFKADLARLQDAVEGTEQGNRPPFNPFNYVGRQVMAKLKVETTDEFGAQNSIAKLEPVTE